VAPAAARVGIGGLSLSERRDGKIIAGPGEAFKVSGVRPATCSPSGGRTLMSRRRAGVEWAFEDVACTV
jgi:hypothetical protein